MGRFFDDAQSLHRQAQREVALYHQTGDTVMLRDGAEKAWGAVVQASNELIEAHALAVPEGTGARAAALRVVERRDRRALRSRLETRFRYFELVLHRDAFYDGTIQGDLEDVIGASVRDYLRTVERLASGVDGPGRDQGV